MLYSAIACLVSYLICNYLKTSNTSYGYLSTKSWMQSRLQTCGNGCETTFAVHMDGFTSCHGKLTFCLLLLLLKSITAFLHKDEN